MEGMIPINHVRLLYDDDDSDPEDDQPSDLDDGKLHIATMLELFYQFYIL